MLNFIKIVIAFVKGIPTILALISEVRKIFTPEEKKEAVDSIRSLPEKDLPHLLKRFRQRRRDRQGN